MSLHAILVASFPHPEIQQQKFMAIENNQPYQVILARRPGSNLHDAVQK